MVQLTDNIQQERLDEIIRVSGSAALTKNVYGITIMDGTDISKSLLYKTLNRDKYDVDEIPKAINLEIKELKPNIPTQRKDLIPKPIYDAEVALNQILNTTISTLNNTISNLQSTVSNLQSEVDSEKTNRLNIELTNDSLVNQLDSLSSTVEDFGQQLSTAIQKSIEESIVRTSLQSQNEGFKAQISTLIKQIDSLNAIIEGLQAQLGALQQQRILESSANTLAFSSGGKVINKVVVASLTSPTRPGDPGNTEIYGKIRWNNGDHKWMSGGSIKINNTDKASVKIIISFTSMAGGNWLIPDATSFTLEPNTNKTVKLNLIPNALTANLYAKWSGDQTVEYVGASLGSTLRISVSREDGTTEVGTYSCGFAKAHDDYYDS